jgi:hypothetical protein
MLTACLVQRIDYIAPPAGSLASSGPADIVRVQRHKIAMWRRHVRSGTESLGDTPLEGTGFEPSVPPGDWWPFLGQKLEDECAVHYSRGAWRRIIEAVCQLANKTPPGALH